MQALLAASRDLPSRHLPRGELLVEEGQARTALYVLASGSLVVSRQGVPVATITEPGSVIGEIAVLLDVAHGATVTAATPTTVHVVTDAHEFLAADHERLFDLARTLALRLDRLSGYLSDVRRQYAGAGGHLGLLDEVLAELTFGAEPPARPGSARDPDPLY